MKSIFEKIENAKVDVLELLQAEDKLFCEQLFAKYLLHVSYIQQLLQYTAEAYDLHQQQTPQFENDFFYEMSKMDKQLEGYEEILTSLHEAVIRKIENHFETKYNIKFKSYGELQKADETIFAYKLETII